MRAITSIAAITLLGFLGACASMNGPSTDDATERLAADCKARGGILLPIRQPTGRPEIESACNIPDGASNIRRE